MNWDAALQAKPFISEAHVFNDAGLSFDVWPPRTGRPTANAGANSVVMDVADNFSHHCDPMDSSAIGTLRLEDHTCLAELDTVAAKHKYRAGAGDDVTALGSVASLSNGSSVVAAGEVFGSATEISRGYLLAVKLWEEAVATVNTKRSSTTPLGAE